MTHIVLADNQALLRSGLRLILERQPDMTVVGEAQNGSEAMALALASPCRAPVSNDHRDHATGRYHQPATRH